MALQRFGQAPSAADRGIPGTPILRDVLEVGVSGQGQGGGFRAPCRNTWKSIGAIAEYGQIVRNRLRFDTELGLYPGLIAHDAAPAVQLTNTCPNAALGATFC